MKVFVYNCLLFCALINQRKIYLKNKEKLLQEIAKSSQNITNQLSILTATEKLETS